MRTTKILAVIAALLSGCSLYYDVVPFDRDGGCATTCDDMHVRTDGGAGLDLGCGMVCDMATSPDLAIECESSSTCPGGQPVCNASGACIACATAGASTECATYHAPETLCGPTGACVQCLSKDDCASLNETCNLATNACGACSQNSDCTTGVCKSGGACASSSEVYYVNNRGAATITACKTANATANGSASNPYCDISDATASASPRPYVVVKGSATAYSALTFTTNATETIIGPGRSPAPTALVFAPTLSPAINVSPTVGQTVTLTVDGLELSGSSGAANQRAGLLCSGSAGTAIVTVRNSFIDNSGTYGVDSSSCTLTLDANIIGPSNTGGGVSINAGSVVASNNLIAGNGNAGPGVLFIGNVGGTWWFNTVADNLRTGANAAGFSCAAATSTPTVQASIVWGNTKDGSGSSVGSGCSFTYTDIDDTTTPTGAGNFNMNPMLTSGTLPTTGYRIPSASPAVNKVTAATGLTGGTLPSHDVDGNARPRASTGGYDVGGSQAP